MYRLFALLQCLVNPSLTFPNHNLFSKRNARCFPTLPPPGPLMYQMDVQDCLDVTRLRSDRPFRPLKFSRSDGFTVPHAWHSGACSILINTIDDDDEDELPLLDIAVTALGIVRRCITSSGPKLGGRDVTGPKQILSVVVMGIVPEKSRYSTLDKDWWD
ncbi:hypothetical protein MMC24_003153 [Lignoscripta atroalba]|nr:hypothetical protein [Lignoscripta atroalba]